MAFYARTPRRVIKRVITLFYPCALKTFLGLPGFLGLIYVWTEHLESLGSEPPKNYHTL